MIALVLNGEDFQFAPDAAPVPDGAEVVPIAANTLGIAPNLLAFDGTAVRRREDIGTWYVDPDGIKHAVQRDETWQQLVCAYADKLVNAAGTWSVISAGAALQEGLTAYANGKQWALATGGYTVTIAGTPRTFSTDTVSMGLITGKAVRFAQANPPISVDWQFAGVGFVTISAADFLAAAVAVADFVQATFDALKPVLAAIAGGTITDTAGVDAAAWPANAQ